MALACRLAEQGVDHHVLMQFHSRTTSRAGELHQRDGRAAVLRRPDIPSVSGVTGTWITPHGDATSPDHFSRLLPHRAFFRRCAHARPGSQPHLPRDRPGLKPRRLPGPQLGHCPMFVFAFGNRERLRRRTLAAHAGGLWLHGASIDWEAVHGGEQRHLATGDCLSAKALLGFARAGRVSTTSSFADAAPSPASTVVHLPARCASRSLPHRFPSGSSSRVASSEHQRSHRPRPVAGACTGSCFELGVDSLMSIQLQEPRGGRIQFALACARCPDCRRAGARPRIRSHAAMSAPC